MSRLQRIMRNRSLVEGKGREGEIGEKVGQGGVGKERRRGEGGVGLKKKRVEERGRRGKSDCQKRGAVVYIATGNRPSYVH